MDSPETLSKDEIALRKAQLSAEKAIRKQQEVQDRIEKTKALQASREQSRLEREAEKQQAAEAKQRNAEEKQRIAAENTQIKTDKVFYFIFYFI